MLLDKKRADTEICEIRKTISMRTQTFPNGVEIPDV